MKRTILILTLIAPLLLLSQQEVTFTQGMNTLTTATRSDHAVGVTDMNGDGLDDIVRMNITNEGQNGSEQTIYVTLQEAPGEPMTDIEVGVMDVSGSGSADAWGLSIVDLDENGRNDVITGGFYNGVYLFKSNADNSAYAPDIELLNEIYVQGMSSFDIDNDGSIDVFICDDVEISQILTNDGSGNMAEVASGLVPETDSPSDNSGNYGSCFMDVNNDGHSDLYIAKCRQGVSSPNNPRRINLLFMNDGQGNWVSEGDARGLAVGAQSWSADFGDYDNDGDLDCFIGNHDVYSDLLENDGNGYFTEVTEDAGLEGMFPFTVIQCTWVDFNNDGYIDILATGTGNHVVALNNGDGTFTTYDDLFGNYPVNSYALGDLNNDGFMDIFHSAGGYGSVASDNWDDRVYFNDGNDHAWWKVNLTGVASNINAVGTRISIYGPWGVQIREVKAGESYGIQHSLTQLFGLGTFQLIDEVVITWPSGTIDHYYNVPVNEQVNYIEGNGVSGLDDQVSEENIVLYPNPASDVLYMDLSSYSELASQRNEVRVYDVLGKIVLSQRVLSEVNAIDITPLASGSYTYSLTSDGKIIAVSDFIKK